MISEFLTPKRIYELEVNQYVCNKFGIAEYFANNFCKTDFCQGNTVLDVGAGVGPLSIFLADQFNTTVVGVDINGDACKCFRKNIKKFGLTDRITVVEEDFSKYRNNFPNLQFDLIVSNPPIDENVSYDVIKEFSGHSYKHPNRSEFIFITNSWHDNNGLDLLDHLFIFANTHLKEGGKIVLSCCAMDGATEQSISKRGIMYGFSVNRSVIGSITTKSIGVERHNISSVRSFYIVLQREP